ncbi:MAG: hypothetical protein HFH41_04130 [Lachnospiraceae bacterium]|nr:hypothetical protein [Lachnospiraceae bacterium]
MSKVITTVLAKKKMLLARAGKQTLPPIKQMVFGIGGVDDSGEVLEIEEMQQELNHEVYRKDIGEVEIISDTQIRYSCILEENELVDQNISEIALADAEGDLIAIKNFKAKGKDSDFLFVFKINDTM